MFLSRVEIDMSIPDPKPADDDQSDRPPPFSVVWPDGENRSGDADRIRSGQPPQRPRSAAGPFDAESTTLSTFYRAWFLPEFLRERKAVSPKTIALYENSVRYWVRLSGDPVLAEIERNGEALCDRFMLALAHEPGRRDDVLSPLTCHKHGRNLQAILTRAGPRVRGVRGCQCIIADVPTFPLPRWHGRPATSDFTTDELRAALGKCNTMGTPKDFDGPTWWRALILLGYHTALRIGTLVRVRWEYVSSDRRWLDVPGVEAGTVMMKGRRAHRVPLHPDALSAIERLPHRTGTIVPWPNFDRFGGRNLLSRWKKLLERAALPPSRRFGFHGIRKCAANAIARVDPNAAAYLLGHATDVTRVHYLNRDDCLSAAVAGMERIAE